MKCAVLALALGFALTLPAQAFLRPRVPHRTHPPLGDGQIIAIVGEDAKKATLPKK